MLHFDSSYTKQQNLMETNTLLISKIKYYAVAVIFNYNKLKYTSCLVAYEVIIKLCSMIFFIPLLRVNISEKVGVSQ